MKSGPIFPFVLTLGCTSLLGLACPGAALDLPTLEKTQQQVEIVSEKALPCVVGLSRPDGDMTAVGSGCLIGRDGLILTAAHVVKQEPVLGVTFLDGKTAHAKVLGADYGRDVALVRIVEPGDYPFLELGDSSQLAAGDPVIVLGYAGDHHPKRTPPVRFGRVVEIEDGGQINSDAALGGGDSGGPLLNLEGKVVGVHMSGSSNGQGAGGYQTAEARASYAQMSNDVPTEAVQTNWNRLLQGEKWGKLSGTSTAELKPGQLFGLDFDRFQERVGQEFSNDQRPPVQPNDIPPWLKEYGMDDKKVDAMGMKEIFRIVNEALEKSGNRSRWQLEGSDLPKLSEAELAGLDMARFRNHVAQQETQPGGTSEGGPAAARGWLREDGMSAERVATMSDAEVTEMIARAQSAPSREEVLAKEDEEVLAAVRQTLARFQAGVVALTDGGRTLVRGTVVRENGFVLTKRSEIAGARELHVKLSDGRDLPAEVVAEFPAQDLALVKVAAAGLTPVVFPAEAPSLHRGEFLFTPGGDGRSLLLGRGVVSVLEHSQAPSCDFAEGVAEGDGGIILSDVTLHGPVAKAGLQRGDRILAVNGATFAQAPELRAWLLARPASEVMQVKYRRGQEEKIVTVTPDEREGAAQSPEVAAVVSGQRSGFPLVFQNDQPLKRDECGSVVVDLRGAVMGVNIARAGQVETYALPARVVADWLEKQDFKALAKKAEGNP